ncbi:hypothetical protein [Agromyces sp. CF514]|uniref:hypothetical protein n=1 Tax=Agromyces sp. CF514 TaxID=1881031 RepID=UPI000B8A4EA6|nr:hypothetical protein [Agromyces sp. CF514]
MLASLGLVALVAAGAVAVPQTAHAAGTATLSLFKRVENLDTGASFGDRGAWDVQAVNVDTGEVIRGQGLNGVQSVVVPAGSYVISEIETAASPPGYRFEQWECGGQVTTEPTRTITLAEGASLTCTVENVAIKPNLTLEKIVDGGGADPALWTLTAQGPSSISGPTGVTGDVRIGRYTLSESGGPTGYTAGPWSCVDETTGEGVPVDGNGSLQVDLGRSIRCTITNTGSLPQLTLVKEVDGPAGRPLDPATDWTLSATGPSTISGATGSTAVSHASVDAGDYVLDETGPSGYSAGAWSCVDETTGQAVPAPGGAVTITDTSDLECTIVNTFDGAWLTLVKTVDGDQPPEDWQLVATGADEQLSGPAGSAEVTDAVVAAGSFDLAESGPTTGYRTDGWQCSNADGFVTSVTLAPGDDVTCTILNVAVASKLTLAKEVVNRGGGTLGAGDWTLTAASASETVSGPAGSADVRFATVGSGTYDLSESSTAPEAGLYTASAWVCVDDATGEPYADSTGETVTFTDAESSVTCTITNTWTQSELTLVKRVVAPVGTPPPATSWQLTGTSGGTSITGASGDAEITDAPVPADSTWDLSEAGPDGFTSLGWTCLGVSMDDADSVTIPGGRSIRCEVTNVGIMPSITLVKDLVDGAGGTATVDDFTLKTRGPGNAAFAGVSGSEDVTDRLTPNGEYVFSEDGPAGYDVTWSCTGADFDESTETATLDYGDEAVCTATNTPIPPTLTLEKSVAGGSADPSDWTLIATGPTTITGNGAVGPETVDAGVYELTESSTATGSPDYVPDFWVCSGENYDSSWLVQTGEGAAELTLPLAADVTCTLVNAYTPPTLTLVKAVDDGPDGPGGTPGDWVLTATGSGTANGTVVTGPGGGPDIVSQVVTTGDYALSEAPNPASPPPSPDYGASAWSCTGAGFEPADLVGATLTLAAGDDVACTITNVFDPPRLTLVKEVVGGALMTADWTLSWTEVDDPTRTGSGATGDAAITDAPVQDGTFRLAEASTVDLAASYTASAWRCTGGEFAAPDTITLVAADVSVTCTITNTFSGGPGSTPPPSESPAPPAGGGTTAGGMASTGTDAAGWLAAAGALLLAGAAALISTSRTRRTVR